MPYSFLACDLADPGAWAIRPARTPNFIERVNNKLPDGGIDTRFRMRGRVHLFFCFFHPPQPPLLSPRPMSTHPWHLPFSTRPQYHDTTPSAFDRPGQDVRVTKVSVNTVVANKTITGTFNLADTLPPPLRQLGGTRVCALLPAFVTHNHALHRHQAQRCHPGPFAGRCRLFWCAALPLPRPPQMRRTS